MESFILASASPRRKALLEQVGMRFSVHPADIEENFTAHAPEEDVIRLSREKVESLLSSNPAFSTCWILGADTIVVCGEAKIGKPESEEEARQVLNLLADNEHRVVTGLTLFSPGSEMGYISDYATTTIRFCPIEDEELNWYLSTGEWKGAAGGYRIQERGGFFVESIIGSYSNVMGLPIHTFYGMLRASNFPVFS